MSSKLTQFKAAAATALAMGLGGAYTTEAFAANRDISDVQHVLSSVKNPIVDSKFRLFNGDKSHPVLIKICNSTEQVTVKNSHKNRDPNSDIVTQIKSTSYSGNRTDGAVTFDEAIDATADTEKVGSTLVFEKGGYKVPANWTSDNTPIFLSSENISVKFDAASCHHESQGGSGGGTSAQGVCIDGACGGGGIKEPKVDTGGGGGNPMPTP